MPPTNTAKASPVRPPPKHSDLNVLHRVLTPLRKSNSKFRRMSFADKTQIKILHEHGHTPSEIARKVGFAQASVFMFVKKGCPLEAPAKKHRPRTSLTPKVLADIKSIVKQHVRTRQPITNAILAAKAGKKGWKKANKRSVRRAKRMLRITSVLSSVKKRANITDENKRLRVQAALERKDISQSDMKRIVWIDESEGQIQAVRQHMIFEGETNDIITVVPDRKDEKVHYLVAVGNGGKAFDHLPLRRLVQRDKTGKAITPTLAAGTRRPRGTTPAQKAKNAKLNKPNEGETWNETTLLKIFKEWVKLDWFKNCYAVVLDNAKPHFSIRTFLLRHKIKVLDHPANSPDMNLAEQVHQTIKQKAKQMFPQNNHELLEAYKKAFGNFDIRKFNNKYLRHFRDQTLTSIIKSKGEISRW
jgi:hypothetical protein